MLWPCFKLSITSLIFKSNQSNILISLAYCQSFLLSLSTPFLAPLGIIPHSSMQPVQHSKHPVISIEYLVVVIMQHRARYQRKGQATVATDSRKLC